MAMMYSPMRTRSQAATMTPEVEALRVEMTEMQETRQQSGRSETHVMASGDSDVDAPTRKRRRQPAPEEGEGTQELLQTQLEAAIQELQILREERRTYVQGRAEAEEAARQPGQSNFNCRLKPDIFDGSTPLSEYIGQFEMIARANNWNDATRAIFLAANLRGRARSILENWEEKSGYEELKMRLSLRFGNHVTYQNSYIQFSSRKQKPGEDYASLGEDLEKMAKFAYPECSPEVRDKISCAQFISAITDNYIKQMIQIENVTSLRAAIERAKTLKLILENNFFQRENHINYASNERRFEQMRERQTTDCFRRNKFYNSNQNFVFKNPRIKEKQFRQEENKNKMECWQCGKTGHFRTECPTLRLPGQTN